MNNNQLFFRIIFLVLASIGSLVFVPSSQGAPTVAAPVWTRVNDDDAAVSYSPNTQAAPNPDYYAKDMHSTTEVGAWCKFAFTGTGVKWIGGKNTDHGKADVFIDGKLDATIDTTAPSWLKQQELYTKTGLSDGPHTLMVQVKTPGYEDFDAFEYLAPPPPPPAPKNLGHVLLPDQVPYLNPKQRYPLGNGAVMAVGEASGEWSQLAGPGYTTPNYISSESLTLEVDGVEKPLDLEMKRARETGIYYGLTKSGDLEVRLIDYACPGQPWLSRLVMIDNASKTNPHDVRLRAMVKPRQDPGLTHHLVKDDAQSRCGVAILLGKLTGIPYGGKGTDDKSVVIAFTEPAGTAFVGDGAYTIETKVNRIEAGDSYHVALSHYFRHDDAPDTQSVAAIRSQKNIPDLETSITEWQNWFRKVGPGYRLGNVTEPRAHDLLEGALAILKTNQSGDGGIIAHSTFYKEGYIRDAALALRGLAATGHFDELKQWLIWVDHTWMLFGHLPDAAACRPSLEEGSAIFDMGNPNVEETAEYLLCARDYYRATKDLATLNTIQKSLQNCMDLQLKEAVANGYKLEFNGDETEICGAVDVTPAGTKMGVEAQQKDWSFSSIGMCAAALNFYIEYLQARGEDPTAYKNNLSGTTMNLKIELAHVLKAMDDDYWRTDVPEIPEGFHDAFRIKSDMAWPQKRIVNFTLMPLYYGAPYSPDEKAKDAAAIAHYFDEKTGFLQLVPGANTGFDGHDLGYLLWALVEVNHPKKTAVYQALINGSTPDCWGTFNEAYTATGVRNDHDLRSLETGCNVSAIAKYWDLKP